MQSLVGDSGQVLGVLGWAGIHDLLLMLQCWRQDVNGGCVWNRTVSCLATKRGEVGLVMLASTREWACRQAVNFLQSALILVQSKLSILRAVDQLEPSLTWEWLSTKAYLDWFKQLVFSALPAVSVQFWVHYYINELINIYIYIYVDLSLSSKFRPPHEVPPSHILIINALLDANAESFTCTPRC